MALFVVSNIVVSADAHGKRMASGGTEYIGNPWRLDVTRLTPLGFA
jgi:hypothetical protein